MSKEINTCLECGIEISSRAKRCHSCASKGKNNAMYGRCGENSFAYIDGRSSKKRFCIDCGKEIKNFYAERCSTCSKMGKNNPNYKHGKSYDNRCVNCGKVIDKASYRCLSCSRKGENNPNYKEGKNLEKYKCIDCGIEISLSSGVYGSGRCGSCSTKERFKNPENTTNWQGGISLEIYPKEFNSRLKKKIRKRDNFTCQNCGTTEIEHLAIYGKVLSVHHIDYCKKHNEDNNLITLCIHCNIRVNFKRNYWQKFFTSKILEVSRNK